MCTICRKPGVQGELIRLTVDFETNVVLLNQGKRMIKGGRKPAGRSAYICQAEECLGQAGKSNKLKYALEGRRIKGAEPKRRISWPLEPQLIQLISSQCTEPPKTCQNTER